jgi:hypothetical protein
LLALANSLGINIVVIQFFDDDSYSTEVIRPINGASNYSIDLVLRGSVHFYGTSLIKVGSGSFHNEESSSVPLVISSVDFEIEERVSGRTTFDGETPVDESVTNGDDPLVISSVDIEIEERVCGINISEEETPAGGTVTIDDESETVSPCLKGLKTGARSRYLLEGSDFASESSVVVPSTEIRINDDEVVSIGTSSIVVFGVKERRGKKDRINESVKARSKRLESDRKRKEAARQNLTDEARLRRLEKDRLRKQNSRRKKKLDSDTDVSLDLRSTSGVSSGGPENPLLLDINGSENSIKEFSVDLQSSLYDSGIDGSCSNTSDFLASEDPLSDSAIDDLSSNNLEYSLVDTDADGNESLTEVNSVLTFDSDDLDDFEYGKDRVRKANGRKNESEEERSFRLERQRLRYHNLKKAKSVFSSLMDAENGGSESSVNASLMEMFSPDVLHAIKLEKDSKRKANKRISDPEFAEKERARNAARKRSLMDDSDYAESERSRIFEAMRVAREDPDFKL